MSNKNYRLIGLTGPTGAGKSAVGRIFSNHGFALVDADKIAHKALTLPECIKKLTEAFGTKILNPDGTINRKAAAEVAFSSDENTNKLNSITHPVILDLAVSEFEALYSKGYTNILFDAPTLFESGSNRLCDVIVCVLAPVDIRIQRIMERDNITKEQALARISAQHNDSYYSEKSRYAIINDCDTATLTQRTEDVIKELL